MLLSSFDLLSNLAAHSKILQESCSGIFPDNLSAAFVCGSKINQVSAESIFRQSGLIHLMVVSGGHLQIIESFVGTLLPTRWLEHKLGRFFLLLGLCAYTLLTGFQAPVVRALTSLLLRESVRYFRWGWNSLQVQLATGILLLCLEPAWIFNFSFYLSWLASLGLLVAPWCFLRLRKVSWKNSVFYFWFSTFCVQSFVSFAFSGFSPLGLVLNALFAPLLGLLLLPVSLASAFFSEASLVWQWLLAFLDCILGLGIFPLNVGDYPGDFLRWIFLWFFVALLHGVLWSLQRARYVGSAL